MARWLLLSTGALWLCWPASALGGQPDTTFCVGTGDLDAGPPGCPDTVCTNDVVYGTTAEAVAALGEFAAALPDPESAHLGLCFWSDEALQQRLVVDNSDGQLGRRLTLLWADGQRAPLCPPNDLADDEALIQVLGPADPDLRFELAMQPIIWDQRTCASGAARLVKTTGASIHLLGSRFTGGLGPLLEVQDSAGGFGSSVNDVRIEGVEGPAASFTGTADLRHVEFSANRSVGEPLLDHAELDLVLTASLFHGNVVEGGADLIRTSSRVNMSQTTIEANVVLGGGSLVHARAGLNDNNPTLFSGLRLSSIAGNMLGEGSGGTPPPILVRPELPPEERPFCLPLAADAQGLANRDAPDAEVRVPNDAPLIRVAGSPSPEGSRFTVAKSFLLGEGLSAAAAFVAVDPDNGGLRLSLLHNTFANAGPTTLVRGSPTVDTSTLSGITAARNLMLGAYALADSAGWDELEFTMNVMAGDTIPHPGHEDDRPDSILGPELRVADESLPDLLEPLAEVFLWNQCQLATAMCPEVAGECDEFVAGNADYPCVLGGARRFVPADPDLLTSSWPWEGGWWQQEPFGGGSEVAGATGWACGQLNAPHDRALVQFGTEGDNDGFTNLVDCDNSDPDVVPRLPPMHGFDSGDCDEAEGVCFVCADDDDDSSTDDDDSSADDDDSSAGTRFGGSPVAPRGSSCHLYGCGFAWDPGEFALILLWLGWRRRSSGRGRRLLR